MHSQPLRYIHTDHFFLAMKIGAVVICGALSYLGTSTLHRSLRGNSKQALRAVKDTVRVSSTDPSVKDGVGVFHLLNDSSKPITVDRIEASCTCTVVDARDRIVVQPGSQYRLQFTMLFPAFGIISSNVKIYYDNLPTPLVLRAEATGLHGLPVIHKVTNDSLAFFDLRSVDDRREILVTTRERVGSALWLDQLESDIPEIECKRIAVKEASLRAADYIEREYIFRIGWRRLPVAKDFRGKIFTRVDKGKKRLVASVSGNRSTP
jgi:Protein of unknown function (DUF1573)